MLLYLYFYILKIIITCLQCSKLWSKCPSFAEITEASHFRNCSITGSVKSVIHKCTYKWSSFFSATLFLQPTLGICKPVYIGLVPKPRNRDGCSRKGIQHKNMSGVHGWVRGDQWSTKDLITSSIVEKSKGKGVYSSLWNSPQNYGMPLVNGITQCYLPPDRGDRPAFTPTVQVGTRFIDPVRMKGWGGLVGWLHTEMVFPSTDGHPSEY